MNVSSGEITHRVRVELIEPFQSHQRGRHVRHLQLHPHGRLCASMDLQQALSLWVHLPFHLCGAFPLHLHHNGHIRGDQELLRAWISSK